MSKRRILQIVGDPVGGIRKHIHDILLGLDQEFDFFYMSSSFGDKTFFREISTISEKISGYSSLNIKKRPALSDILNVVKICAYVRKNKIQVIHGHGAKGGLYARICGKLMGCKVIYTPHGGVVHSMFGKYENMLYKVIECSLCWFTDLLIFESNYTAEAFNKKFGCPKIKKIVNYNGVLPPDQNIKKDFSKATHETEFQVKKLGVFGLIREQKGQHLAMVAVKSLIKRGHKLQLHFYGDGPLRKKLQKEVKVSQLENDIFFHGEVENVYHYMKQMDFVFIPSLYESFGYVAVESMFAKKAIISSNAGGLKEVIPKNLAFIFESGNVSSIEDAIYKALSMDVKKLDNMLERAYDHAMTSFQVSKMILNIKKIYLYL